MVQAQTYGNYELAHVSGSRIRAIKNRLRSSSYSLNFGITRVFDNLLSFRPINGTGDGGILRGYLCHCGHIAP